MNANLKGLCTMLAGCLLVALTAMPVAHASEPSNVSRPVLLVANPKLGEFYGQTVLIVRPVGNDQHVGFIVNRPTKMTLGKLFPEHKPSAMVTDPVFLGGPANVVMICAVGQRDGSAGGLCMAGLDHVWGGVVEGTGGRMIV
jgi:hypothetical protein